MINRTKGFLENVKSEFKKVQWPTRQATFKSTYVVVILSAMIAVFLWTVDTGLSQVMKALIYS